jgi:hypothetical protein
VKKAGKNNTKKKTQTLPERRLSNKKPEYTKKTVETGMFLIVKMNRLILIISYCRAFVW